MLMHHNIFIMKNRYIKIENTIINLTSIDYVAKSDAPASPSDETIVHGISIIYKSGVQIKAPFKTQESRDYVFKVIEDKLAVSTIQIPQMGKA